MDEWWSSSEQRVAIAEGVSHEHVTEHVGKWCWNRPASPLFVVLILVSRYETHRLYSHWKTMASPRSMAWVITTFEDWMARLKESKRLKLEKRSKPSSRSTPNTTKKKRRKRETPYPVAPKPPKPIRPDWPSLDVVIVEDAHHLTETQLQSYQEMSFAASSPTTHVVGQRTLFVWSGRDPTHRSSSLWSIVYEQATRIHVPRSTTTTTLDPTWDKWIDARYKGRAWTGAEMQQLYRALIRDESTLTGTKVELLATERQAVAERQFRKWQTTTSILAESTPAVEYERKHVPHSKPGPDTPLPVALVEPWQRTASFILQTSDPVCVWPPEASVSVSVATECNSFPGLDRSWPFFYGITQHLAEAGPVVKSTLIKRGRYQQKWEFEQYPIQPATCISLEQLSSFVPDTWTLCIPAAHVEISDALRASPALWSYLVTHPLFIYTLDTHNKRRPIDRTAFVTWIRKTV